GCAGTGLANPSFRGLPLTTQGAKPMRILDARIHFILDVAFALAFVLGPLVFGLGGSPAVVCFLIALTFVFLAATVWWRSRHETAGISILHGLVELGVGVLLAGPPGIDGRRAALRRSEGSAAGSPARRFVWTMAIAVGVVWLLTAYGDARKPALSREAPAPR